MRIKNVFSNYFLLLTLSLLILFITGMWYFIFDIDIQKCDMTYMFEYSEYKRYSIPEIKENLNFKKYGLYYYMEGMDNEVLRGTPVLFIPGNCGSFKQVRSLASVSRQISFSKYPYQMFNYFSVDLNEELSCASANIVNRQIAFVIMSIKRIKHIYKENFKKVILVGHSMGGFIARASLMSHEINDFVSLIITLAAPLEFPVAGFDPDLIKLYNTVNQFWSNQKNQVNLPLISITGGNRDIVVWDGYGKLKYARHGIWVPVTSIPKVGVSTDHLCIAWCRQLMLAINRCLYANINLNGLFKTNPDIILQSFRKEFIHNFSYANLHNVHIRSYFKLLFYSTSVTLGVNDNNYFQLHALSHVTRPLRIQINHSQCHEKSTKVSVILSKLEHSYQRQVTLDYSVLLSLSAKPESHETVILKLHAIHGCQYSILIGASVFDWTATLIRIHFGRFPAFISAFLVLKLFNTGVFGFFTFTGLSCLGLITNSGLGQLYEIGLIDLYDILLLISLSLPLAQGIFWANFFVFRIMTYLVRLFLFFKLFLIILFIPTSVAIIFGSNAPVVGAFCLWLCFFFSSAFQIPNYEISKHDPGVSVIILVLTLIQLPPSFARWHSISKNINLHEVLQLWSSEIMNFSTYRFLDAHVILLSFILFRILKIKPEQKKTSKLRLSFYWLSSVIIASGCVIEGSVDIFKCVPFLTTAIIVIESANFISI